MSYGLLAHTDGKLCGGITEVILVGLCLLGKTVVKTYTAADGTFFKVHYQARSIAGYSASTKIRKATDGSFKGCMKSCSAEPGCTSVDYAARLGTDHRVKECTLFRTGGGDNPDATVRGP